MPRPTLAGLLTLITLLSSACASSRAPASAPPDEEPFPGFAGEDELKAREAERARAPARDESSGGEVECLLAVDEPGCRPPVTDPFD